MALERNIKEFQSAPPHGGRLAAPHEVGSWFEFQSAPPHGGRPPPGCAIAFPMKFQSAPPHGGRPQHRNQLITKAELDGMREPRCLWKIGIACVYHSQEIMALIQ